MAHDWEQELPEVAEAVRGFEYDLRKLTDGVEAGLGALRRGDFHGGYEMLGLTHYAIGRLPDRRAEVLRALEAAGFGPRPADDPGPYRFKIDGEAR